MGRFDSSVTRVRPVFSQLVKADPTGQTWLPKVLLSATRGAQIAQVMARSTGSLDPSLLSNRSYPDRSLKRSIRLPELFEHRAPAPERFLAWMIRHPAQLRWPRDGGQPRRFGEETQQQRARLFAADVAVANAALDALVAFGPHGSDFAWWCFEGWTEIDCFLSTDRILLAIEGKRTEPLSSATSWYPRRNQLMRNLEVASTVAAGRPFGLMLVAEEAIEVSDTMVVDGLPHLDRDERDLLMRHYLGCVQWRDLCASVGVDYDGLPHTIDDV